MNRTKPACLLVPLAIILLSVPVRPQEAESPPPPVFTGLIVKVATSREESGPPRGPAETAAKQLGRGQPWTVGELPGSAGTFRLSPSRAESSELSPAEAWQRAHALRKDPAFEFVEPSFAVPGAVGETTEIEDCVAAPLVESGSATKHIPGAEKDSEWSLGANGANVLLAWKAFGANPPGEGVWIGHPDTGYRQHPEIWVIPDGPLQPSLAWDFVDNDDDPTDAFKDGMLRWPGHGTRTSSAIVSPKGRQLPGIIPRGISGVAPGAKLIPLRVANGVVLFDQANLASAIRAAAGDDRNLVKQKVDVISISLGGPPSRELEDAVKFAEQRGVLVIAAAGNNVKKVIWPARYPHVIAVSASNFDSRVWSGSSGGSMVAIGAPGESVWIASPRMQDKVAINCLSMSSGTSYATATTAGIAAMWVSLHRDKPQFKSLRSSGGLTSEFRRILRATKRPGTDWDTSKYGAGIVDAAAVLAAPLGGLAESAPGVAPSRCDRDLAALVSLFDETSFARVRIASLFNTRVVRLCSIASLADEVAFLYATNTQVAAAIDRIASTGSPSAADYSTARRAVRAGASPVLRSAVPDR